MQADKGTHASGTVSAVMKSGTNMYHGDLFEFFRNGVLNARNSFALRRDTLSEISSASVAPSRKTNYSSLLDIRELALGRIPRIAPVSCALPRCCLAISASVPLSREQFIDPLRSRADGKKIDPSRFSPQALAIVKLLPKATGPCGQTSFGPVQKTNEYQTLGRIDYMIQQQADFVFPLHGDGDAYFASSLRLLRQPARFRDRQQTTSLKPRVWVTHTCFSPTTVNSFRIAVDRVEAYTALTAIYFSPCDIRSKVLLLRSASDRGDRNRRACDRNQHGD